MANIDIDTEKFKNYGEDVKKYANEFNVLINNLFKRIQEVPTKTGEWLGTSSDKFAAYSVAEQKLYNEFAERLYNFGNLMVKYAGKIDESKNKCNINEVNK